MKTSMSWLGAARLPVLALLFLFCCSDPEADEVTPPPQENEELTPAEADAALESFIFASSSKITGSVPPVVNTSLVKTDNGDTVYVLPGIKNLIQISHPKERPVKGVYIAASGSTFYYNAPVLEEEESDTISIIMFEIKAEDVDGTMNVPVEITPYDDNSQPIDVIERIISVEEPSGNGCSILQDGDTTEFGNLHGWLWKWSVILDMNDQVAHITTPGGSHQNDFIYEGCCKGSACPTQVLENGVRKWKYDKEFDVSTYYYIAMEWFEFYKNGTFLRQTVEVSSGISNADADTDWCTEEPVISDYIDDTLYFGAHDYAPGDASISYGANRTTCKDPLGLCGYGSRGGALTASCHAMTITSSIEGQRSIRMYTRQYGSAITIEQNGVRKTIWRD